MARNPLAAEAWAVAWRSRETARAVQTLRKIGELGSSWLCNAVFGCRASVLRTPYRRQSGPAPASDPV
jgi:hypothetical protein